MIKRSYLLFVMILFSFPAWAEALTEDSRISVEVPDEVQQHFLKRMREHMEALDLIIAALAADELLKAADIAEEKLGRMCGKGHGDHKGGCHDKAHSHKSGQHAGKKRLRMGQYMPEPMRMMGRSLHASAIEFAEVARHGDSGEALKSLRNISATCVACHQAYKLD